MANCSNCGDPVESDDAFCSTCGAKVAVAPAVVSHDAGPAALPAAAALAEPYPPVQQPAYAATQSTPAPGLRAQMSTNGWIMCGAAAAVFIGALLPWVQASSSLGISVSAKPHSGGVFLFWILGAAALAFGWPVIRGELSKRRLLGLAVTAAALTLFAVTNWSDLSHLQSTDNSQSFQISAGFGLYLYTAGVIALWVCVARVFLALRHRNTAPA